MEIFDKDDIRELQLLGNEIISDLNKKIRLAFDRNLREYVTKNLNELGYQFNTETEFVEFVKERIYQIGFEDRPHYFEIYLDFIDHENRGTFIGCYFDNISFSYNESKIMVTIGRNFCDQ